MNKTPLSIALTALLPTLLLFGCGGDSDSNVSLNLGQDAVFEVRILNLTHNQPLSPPGVVLHRTGYSAFQAGQPASVGLEVLAEGGDPADWIAQAETDNAVLATVTGNSPVGPGGATTLSVAGNRSTDLAISLATMLVNTNDAFTGRSGIAVGQLAVQDSLTMNLSTYDAGTEANTETVGTIPGPAAGGEGFNALRDDHNFVSIHGGVVTRDDGLATSVLDESHRFIGPTSRIIITRTQ
ncbi:MAG: spondin domain-containing protein [Candidatus Competibacteraceae bacterium]